MTYNTMRQTEYSSDCSERYSQYFRYSIWEDHFRSDIIQSTFCKYYYHGAWWMAA